MMFFSFVCFFYSKQTGFFLILSKPSFVYKGIVDFSSAFSPFANGGASVPKKPTKWRKQLNILELIFLLWKTNKTKQNKKWCTCKIVKKSNEMTEAIKYFWMNFSSLKNK